MKFFHSLRSLVFLLACAAAPAQVVNFESPQAHSIAVSTDGSRLYAVNTADNSLSVYSLERPGSPVLLKEIRVGIGPVSVALRTTDEAWVVNHVSDSISIVSVSLGAVIETVLVGDEPGDVVFAGNPQRAFVTSMTRRHVEVFDTKSLQRTATVPVFGDDPRALLTSADGKTVWVAITRSGNRTTIVPHTIAPAPPKPTNTKLPLAPKQGILVSSEDTVWKPRLKVNLPDIDVVEIDVATTRVRRNYSTVGTSLFNLALRPGTNEIWVANTDSRNLARFEPVLKGHAINSQVTRIDTGATPKVTPVNINPGIDYTKFPNGPALSSALSQPTDIVFEADGKTAYVTAYGTDRIGVLNASGAVVAFIEVGDSSGIKVSPRTKRGPRAMALHPTAKLLYVLNRLSSSIVVIDTQKRQVTREVQMFDPSPKVIREGRGFLYDAKLSGNGTMSCASCHIDGRTDGLAWDLGDPGGQEFSIGTPNKLHPMKGPLLTQTLQGMNGEGLFHWRADRVKLNSFNGTFVGLMGASLLSNADMQTFADFMNTIRFMPNPNRNRDDTLSTTPKGTSAAEGEALFRTKQNVGKDGNTQFRCFDCHTRSNGAGAIGFQGLIGQQMKAAQLRGLYKRDGRRLQSGNRTAGFGFGADGSVDDLQAFMSQTARFNPLTANEKTALERFLVAFPGDYVPAMGFSRTVTAANLANQQLQVDLGLLIAQANASKIDLVAVGVAGREQVGYAFDTATQRFESDRAAEGKLTPQQLLQRLGTPLSVLTVMGVPRGTGRQFAIDRDLDGILNRDEGGVRYGKASPACASVIQVYANSEPKVGNRDFAVVVTGASANGLGWVMGSTRRANATVADLNLLVDLSIGLIFPARADATGTATLPFAVANDRTLIGLKINVQAAMTAPCGVLGAAASAGLEVLVR